jgi:hypothetical protein
MHRSGFKPCVSSAGHAGPAALLENGQASASERHDARVVFKQPGRHRLWFGRAHPSISGTPEPQHHLISMVLNMQALKEGASVDAVLAITGNDRLLAQNPLLERSIRNRFPYVDPLNYLQIDLLRKHRAGDDDPKSLTEKEGE